jgi:gliding motility-associated-like protein
MAGYSWNPTSYNAQHYTVYNPGTYSLTVTDSYGCSATSNAITVTWDTSVTPPTAVGDTVCAGDTAMLIASIASGPLEWYASFPSSNQLSANDTFLIAPLNNSTIYYVTTQNGAGCHSIWIPVNAIVYETSLLPLITNDTLACFGDSIQLSTNAINGASYAWTGPDNFTSAVQNPVVAVANTVSAGTYSLTTSGFGCTSPIATIEIDVMQPLPVFTTGNTVICEGESVQIDVHAQHQPVTIYYLDTLGIALADSVYTTGSLPPGNFDYLFYESYYGCEGPVNSHTVTVKPRPWLNAAASNLPVCTGDSVHLFTSDIPNAVYSWSGPNNFSGSGSEITFANADSTLNGNYYVSAVLNGCAGDTVSIHISVFPGTSVSLGNDTTVCEEDNYVIDAGPGYAYYYWDNGAITQTIPVDSTRIYALVVANNYGCVAYDSILISVINCNPVLVNVFTPNGDGVNDVFRIAGEQFQDVECTIFDRWGIKINSWKGKEGSWDGTNQKKEIMPTGTYYYVGTLTDYRGYAYELTGFIQLSR